jgi:hypothetical protein
MSKIECKTKGLTNNGAMCPFILVGGKFCAVSIGKCPNQEKVNAESYYYDGNNRGSYDVLKKDEGGNIRFVAEVMNIDDTEKIVFMFNGE